MSNEELEKFKKEYSESINLLVDMHNNYIQLINSPFNFEFLKLFSSSSRKYLKTIKPLLKSAKLVQQEGRANKKEIIRQRHEAKKLRQELRKRKINEHNRTNSNSI